jgi:hypothetical protein
MNKKMVGLLGAASAVASLSGAQAATPSEPDVRSLMEVHSFAELLTPIPNAVSVLEAMDAAAVKMPRAPTAPDASETQVAQFYYHDHHHHHHSYRRFYHHHHHSHWRRPRYHHHHHHHHHSYRY